MKIAVIVVAAGSGARLGAGMPKAFAPLCGEPLLVHALRGVFGCREVGHVVIVAPASHVDQCRAAVGHFRVARDGVDGDQAGDVGGKSRVGVPGDVGLDVVPSVRLDVVPSVRLDIRVDVVAGGADRSASVEAGLAALCDDDAIVLVHDVARCLAPPALFARVILDVRAGHPAVVPGLPVTDTVKVVDAEGRVLETPDRESLRGIQTPQGFLREVLEHAHSSGASATDDAGLVERDGGRVRVVDGDRRAFKITSPLDLSVATALLQDGSYAE